MPGFGGWSVAHDVNNSGIIVGEAFRDGANHAVAWRYGQIIDLGLAPGRSFAIAWAINNAGIAVGYDDGGAVVWDVANLADNTPPVITFSGATMYTVDQQVAVSCTAVDPSPGSGLASVNCPTANGPAYSYALGPNTLNASATDVAGNSSSASFTFTVVVTRESVCVLVRRWVSDTSTANTLCRHLARGATRQFIRRVQSIAGDKLTTEQADILIRLATAL